MNDFGMLIVAFSVVFLTGVTMISLLGRKTRGGLVNAKIGQVYNFEYEQPLHGEPERYLAKVLDVYTLSNDSIRRLNKSSRYRRNDPMFQRTHHLVTAQTFDGKIRNFYAERTKNVRRSLFGGVLLKTGLASLLF